MSKKNIVLVVHANQGYIRPMGEDDPSINEPLFTAISETYLPLLRMMTRLDADRIPFRLGLVLSAPLCSLLCDSLIQRKYIEWVDARISLGEKEIKRCAKNKSLLAQAESCLEKAKQDKIDFTETYSPNLVDHFRAFAELGYIELIATCGTYAFLPHYSDLTEAVNAQVETGIYAQRYFFGESGEGFWLPYKGFASGTEQVLRSYGVNYTIVDARSLLFTENPVPTGIFAPVRCDNSLVLFGSDSDKSYLSYCRNSAYRCQQKDIGFELSASDLSSFLKEGEGRIQTLCKYWANGELDEYEDEDSDSCERPVYDAASAREQAASDAKTFYDAKCQVLEEAASQMGEEDATLVCTFDAEYLGQTWFEGIDWLEALIRLISKDNILSLELCRNLIQAQFSLPKTSVYPCAENGTGYGEDLLDSKNSWMQLYLRVATERMIDLTERFPSETGLKARLLNLGSRELLLAQSGEWPQMLHDGKLPDYVSNAFTFQVLNFTRVFDSLASNSVSTEWLTGMEKKHPVFPWMNYKIFARKK